MILYSDAREVALEPLQCQEEAEEAEQDLHEAIARELRRLRPLLSAKLPETNGELKALYKKYDTRQRGSLTLLEWTKLVADLAIRPAVPLRDLERVHDHFLEATGAFTFDDLLLCVKAPQGDAAGAQGAASAPTSTKALQKLLLRVLYDKTSHMSGTLALTAFFEESDADKDGLVTAEEFWATISRYEIAAVGLAKKDIGKVFDVWAVEGSKKVDVAEFVEAYRSRADLDLYEAEFDHAVNVIRNNIYFLMGKQQNFERVRGLFAGDDADASALDLAAFTSRIQEFIPEEIHPMLQITIECVFNAFATDRLGTVKLDRFVRYLLKEKKKKVQTLSKEDTVRLLKQLQAILFEGYSLTHKLTHTRYVLNRFSNEDLDNDGQLTLREFVRVIRAFNVQLSDAEIEALFNVFCQDTGKLDIEEFIRAVRSFQRSAIESPGDLQQLLKRIRQGVENMGYRGVVAVLRVFECYDTDSDGHIDFDEFERAVRRLLGPTERPLSHRDFRLLFDAFDAEREGTIDFRHFFEQVGWVGHSADAEAMALPPRPRVERGEEAPPEGTPEGSPAKWSPGKRGTGTPDYERLERMAAHIQNKKVDGRVFTALSEGRDIQTPFDTVVETTPPPAHKAWQTTPSDLEGAQDIGEWLGLLGYGKYLDLFEENEVGLAELKSLRESDLTQMGLPLGPRRRILQVIAQM